VLREAAAPPELPALEADRRMGLFAALRRNLAGGLRLLILRRVPPERFVRSFDQVLLLLVLSLLLWAGLDWLHAERGAQLQLDGLFGWAAYLMAGLLAAAWVARAQDPQTDTRALLVPTLAAAPFVLALLWLLSDTPFIRGRPLLAVSAALVYFELVGLRAIRAAYERPRRRAVLLAAALILAAPFVLDSFGLDTRLWLVDEADQAQDEDVSTTESLLYDQPARIAAAVQRVTPTVPGKPGLFFVGFAGVGEQAVFKREALYAQQVFADKFGTAARSVELINDIRDRDSYPLASVSGLDQAVTQVAARMDPDEDVLVLMLTSHGSEDGLAVSNGSLPLAQLGPADLQEILDDSRIKWRIVIVSACYSGVFLDELKSDTTLIVTAADAGHSSFGCDDSRELTWFGEAFLRDSLPKASSFEEAFKNAAALVRQRETAEHQIHSNPQLFMGPLMREKLAELQSGTAPAPATPAPASGTRTALGTMPRCPRSKTPAHLAPCRLPS
jgi:Peptidase C13 family